MASFLPFFVLICQLGGHSRSLGRFAPTNDYAACDTSGALGTTVGFCQMASNTTWPFTGEM